MVLRRRVVLSAMHREFEFILPTLFLFILIVGDLDFSLMTAKMNVSRQDPPNSGIRVNFIGYVCPRRQVIDRKYIPVTEWLRSKG